LFSRVIEMIKVLVLLVLLTSCVGKYDQFLYQQMTFIKPEVLMTYYDFTNQNIPESLPRMQLKIAQIESYASGKNTNDEVSIMIVKIKNRFDRDVTERTSKWITNSMFSVRNGQTNITKNIYMNNVWNPEYMLNKRNTMEMMWDIVIKSEASKPR
jgi:hypothetical protein